MKHGESPGMGKSSSRDWMGVGQWEHLLGHEYQCKRRQDNDGITDGSTDHSGLGFGIVAVVFSDRPVSQKWSGCLPYDVLGSPAKAVRARSKRKKTHSSGLARTEKSGYGWTQLL